MPSKVPNIMQQWLKFTLIFFLGISLNACQHLPAREVVKESHYIADTQGTGLGRLLAPYKEKNPDLTGYQMLIDPIGAIAARLILIQKAEKSLDLQYYIWHNDKVGALTLEALLHAADRGVRVRLLLDDNNTDELDAILQAISQHPNFEVRLFNPFMYRNWRSLNYVLDFKRNNRRMHNKTFIADSQVALIGGRNISNQYYDAGESFQFSDIDVLMVGKVVPDVAQSFDDYWNYQMSYPATQIIDKADHQLTLDQLRRQLGDYRATIPAQNYLEIAKEQAEFYKWLQRIPDLDWVNANLVLDPPEKINDTADSEQYLLAQLQKLINPPKGNLDIISAYFVPADEGTKALIKLKKQGVRVRVLTNSYAANDVGIVHAFYAKRRKELLENGIELYEFLPQLKTVQRRYFRKDRIRALGGSPVAKDNSKTLGLDGSSDASLHAKMMLIDNQQAFIGSFNFDPRSANLNTEIGVLLESPKLATQVSKDLDNSILNIAYRVSLDPNGNMIWEEKTPNGLKIHTKEPNIKPITKFGLKMIAKLPLDGLM